MTNTTPAPSPERTSRAQQAIARRKRPAKGAPDESAANPTSPHSVSHVFVFPSLAAENIAFLRLRMALAGQKLRFDSAAASAILQDMVGSALSPGTESHLEDELVSGETRHARRSHQIEVLRQAGIPDDRVAGVWAIAQPTACETKTVGRAPAELRLASMARHLGKRQHERFTCADGEGVVWTPSKAAGSSGEEFFHLFVKSDGSEIICLRYPRKMEGLEARSIGQMRHDSESVSAECLADALDDLGYWPSSDFRVIDGDHFGLFDCLNRDALEVLAAAHAPTSSMYGTLARVSDEGGPLWDLVSRHPLLVDLLHFELSVEPSNPFNPIRMLENAIAEADARVATTTHRPSYVDLAPIQHVTPRAAHGFGSAHLGHLVRFGQDRAPRTTSEWDSFLNFYGVITGSAIELAMEKAREDAWVTARATRNFDAIDWAGRVQDCVEGLRKLPDGLAWHRAMNLSLAYLSEILETLKLHCESMLVVQASTAHLTRNQVRNVPAPIDSPPSGPLSYPSTVLDVDGTDVAIAIISDKTIEIRSSELFISDLISTIALVQGRLVIKNGTVAQNNLLLTDASSGAPLLQQSAKAACDRFAKSVSEAFLRLSRLDPQIIAEAMTAYDLRKKKRLDAIPAGDRSPAHVAAQSRKVAEMQRDLATGLDNFKAELDRLGLSHYRAAFTRSH
ncbi:hypothetical protein [Bosea sp. RAC05]|uniref:hypothetical protein n=1 Tax=Bosea sp. RAC05 TaxID=1842539 RepID=UPI001237899D|nr:hypothetical protein [Bosea sp. RAC05]